MVLVLKYRESNAMGSALNTWQMPQTGYRPMHCWRNPKKVVVNYHAIWWMFWNYFQLFLIMGLNKTYIQTMKNGTVAPPCVKFHVEIPSAVWTGRRSPFYLNWSQIVLGSGHNYGWGRWKFENPPHSKFAPALRHLPTAFLPPSKAVRVRTTLVKGHIMKYAEV